MKKLLIIMLLAALLIVFSSCADAVVSYGLSDDNSVKIDYTIALSPSEENVSSYISSISKYWNDLGFTTDDTEENGTYTLSGTKTINSDSRSAAAAELSSILTEENSLFYDAVFTYTPSYFEDNYSFGASVSLNEIIRKNEEHTIPAGEVDALIASAKQGEYKLKITLPGEVIKTNADKQSGQECEWLLKYGETRYIELSSKKAFEENAANYAALEEAQDKDRTLFLVCAIAAGALLLFIVIAVIIRRSSRSRRLKIRSERF